MRRILYQGPGVPNAKGDCGNLIEQIYISRLRYKCVDYKHDSARFSYSCSRASIVQFGLRLCELLVVRMLLSSALVVALLAGAEASQASWEALDSKGLLKGYPKVFQDAPPVSLLSRKNPSIITDC